MAWDLLPLLWGVPVLLLAGLVEVVAWMPMGLPRVLRATVWYGQLGLALAVTTLAAWMAGRAVMRFICLRLTLAIAPLWRWPTQGLRLGLMVAAGLLVFAGLMALAGLLFGMLAPGRGLDATVGEYRPLLPGIWAWLGRQLDPALGWLHHRAEAPGWLGGLLGWLWLPAPAFTGSGDWWMGALVATRLAPLLAACAGLVGVHQEVRRCRDLVRPALPGERRGALDLWLFDRQFEAPPFILGDPPPRGTGRDIVVLCDGTGNRPDKLLDGQPAVTNVCKLSRALVQDTGQVTFYLPGVGSGLTSSERGAARAHRLLQALGPNPAGMAAAAVARLVTLFGNAFGTGITSNIVAGYQEIARQYQPGDRIHLIGFSRGAYTARCIAGVIRRCGLLMPGNYSMAEEVVRLYLTRSNTRHAVPLRQGLIHPPQSLAVEFLGVFDTVGALGVPLWGWWFNLRIFRGNRNFDTEPAPIVRHICHAMAMDERRSQFFPTPFTIPPPDRRGWTETLEQVWFRGAHADVGGGYAESGLSDVTLAWMRRAAESHGLRFAPGSAAALRPDPLAPMHDELTRNPTWRLFGSWPRWQPVPGGSEAVPVGPPEPDGSRRILPSRLHPSVLQRARANHAVNRLDFTPVPPNLPAFSETAIHAPGVPASDDRGGFGPAIHALGATASGDRGLAFRIEAHREWDRTGITIERGGCYRITWTGSTWRDGLEPPCGPEGQESGIGDIARWAFRFRRRLPRQPWMTLCATVAHPREWVLREYPLWRAFYYMFWRDPAPLRRQVLPIGLGMAGVPPAVCLAHHAEPGLLYLFANDLWQTAGNNTGGLELRIERIEAPRPEEVAYVINARGGWHCERNGQPWGGRSRTG